MPLHTYTTQNTKDKPDARIHYALLKEQPHTTNTEPTHTHQPPTQPRRQQNAVYGPPAAVPQPRKQSTRNTNPRNTSGGHITRRARSLRTQQCAAHQPQPTTPTKEGHKPDPASKFVCRCLSSTYLSRTPTHTTNTPRKNSECHGHGIETAHTHPTNPNPKIRANHPQPLPEDRSQVTVVLVDVVSAHAP
jgi:hypothetical protein